MSKGEHLGELEELILLTVGSLQDDAYGVSIMDEIKSLTGRDLNVSAVHAVLKRLETKGYLKSWMGGATQERGGRRKRFFSLTAAGKSVIDQSMSYRMKLYNNIPDISFNFSA
ncbi:MAG: PadR family transcriptional regulator [Flammeovirgaceae bacterium]|nr:PadR family transcriptional regulator [Flammeovirgaceae bacterium]MBE62195.1 PadR family transcriptional regulator [Flammeovirgaceae bacterium]MBR08927.1 PadR family transcriptional regulator [Rickettsiales bacterium]HCX20299.1 PadR family transcriptional regulator [Cytophagales bacterium]|tara:strand:- start:18 stop:356 length:339 start_codon:yes stop_codon:yes gene_type:complete